MENHGPYIVIHSLLPKHPKQKKKNIPRTTQRKQKKKNALPTPSFLRLLRRSFRREEFQLPGFVADDLARPRPAMDHRLHHLLQVLCHVRIGRITCETPRTEFSV